MARSIPYPPVPGRHVCGVASSAAAQAAAAVRWVTEGLDAGMKVIWAQPRPGPLERWLDRAGVDWSAAVERGQLRIADPADLIGIRGDEDFAPRAEAATAMARGAVAEGYAGVSVGVECGDALAVMPDVATQTRFEAVWEDLTRREPLWLLCLMGPAVPPAQLLDSIASHPRELAGELAGARVAGAELVLHGEVDLSNADQLRRFLDVAAAEPSLAGEVVEIDAAALDFSDVTGVRALAAFAETIASRRLRIRRAPASLQRVVDLTGLGAVMDVEAREPVA